MKDDPRKTKISPEFAERLARLGPKQKVLAIVLLHGKSTGKASAPRRSHVSRQAAVDSKRKSAEQVLTDIDNILKRVGGQRLAKSPDALGSIPVQTTAAGINDLAASKHVKAILEDQKISLIP